MFILTLINFVNILGMKLTGGSLPRKDIRATSDGDAVANLKRAGVIILGVTNTPEYCMCCETYNYVTGRTNNPYDLRRSSAGSSGGEVRYKTSICIISIVQHILMNNNL